jgi:hypothetical protein
MFKRKPKAAAAAAAPPAAVPQRAASMARQPSANRPVGIGGCLSQAQGALDKLRRLNPCSEQAFPLLNEIQRLSKPTRAISNLALHRVVAGVPSRVPRPSARLAVEQLREETNKLPNPDKDAWAL